MSQLTDRVSAALAELGTTPDLIADHLRALGIVGKVGDCALCPIAVFLARRFPQYVITVDGDTIGLQDTEGYNDLRTPEAVADFIPGFDDGDYPKLERQ